MKIKSLLLIIVVCLLVVSSSFAEESSTKDRAMQAVATDLANLHNQINTIYNKRSSTVFSPTWGGDQKFVMVSSEKAKLHSGAGINTGVVTLVDKGEKYQVIDKVSDWYAVKLDQPIGEINAAWLSAEEVTPQIAMVSSGGIDFLGMYEELSESVKALKDKYEKNPYVKVAGFTVNIGLPPSVSISFEFK